MRRQEFPLVTFVSLVALVLATAWQVHRAMEFSNRTNAVSAVDQRPFTGKNVGRIALPELDAEPRKACITVFRPPKTQGSGYLAPGFRVIPRPKFTFVSSDEEGVSLQLNGGAKVVGLRRGGFFDYQGERYYLIDVKTNQVTLHQSSNRRRFTAVAGVDPGQQRDHHHL
ncbi:MAG: hypothetical protein ACPGVU_00720 [Limisphaerales bacterium]